VRLCELARDSPIGGKSSFGKAQCREAKSQRTGGDPLREGRKVVSYRIGWATLAHTEISVCVVAVSSLNARLWRTAWAILRVHGETHCAKQQRSTCSGVEIFTQCSHGYHGRSRVVLGVC
jgi:hypothetical protein